MHEYNDIIAQFKPISLEELDSIKNHVRLLKRHDTKFVFTVDKLGALLEHLVQSYRILEINSNRVFKYKNLYFDTDDYRFYRHHHNRKLNRHKFRYRQYVDAKTHFWEVKFKNNKRKTSKTRFEQDHPILEMTEDIKKITRTVLPDNFQPDLDLIKPQLWTSFQRILLANLELEERVTIDAGLAYQNLDGDKKELTGIIVAEVKQARQSLRSPFMQTAKAEQIYRKTFSKYCTGIAMLKKPAKVGRFKRRIMHLENAMRGVNHHAS